MEEQQLGAILAEADERAVASGETIQKTLARMVLAARTRNGLLIPGWSLPEPPVCPECGDKGVAAVHWTGDGWTWGWECDSGCTPAGFWHDGEDGEDYPIDWPFVENRASSADWRMAGFEIV